MKVETFEVSETQGEHPECADEARAIMEELSLNGQLALVTPPSDGSATTSFPYREMTKDEHIVYSLICGQKTALHEYRGSQIPLRVLQVAAHARDHFDHLFVLHPEQYDPDPVLIGIKGTEWSGHRYILARWGEELDEWPALVDKAMAIYADQMHAAIDKCRGKLDALAARISGGKAAHLLPLALEHNGEAPRLYNT